jgi:hypothetical protein
VFEKGQLSEREYSLEIVEVVTLLLGLISLQLIDLLISVYLVEVFFGLRSILKHLFFLVQFNQTLSGTVQFFLFPDIYESISSGTSKRNKSLHRLQLDTRQLRYTRELCVDTAQIAIRAACFLQLPHSSLVLDH